MSVQRTVFIATFLLCFIPTYAQGRAQEESRIQISYINKYDTKKYDRKAHHKYNSKENKHNAKYDKRKHQIYNGLKGTKKKKYDKKKHNKYNNKEKTKFKKHTKKHTDKYYSKYSKYAR